LELFLKGFKASLLFLLEGLYLEGHLFVSLLRIGQILFLDGQQPFKLDNRLLSSASCLAEMLGQHRQGMIRIQFADPLLEEDFVLVLPLKPFRLLSDLVRVLLYKH
jgi:hypothetical protein